MTIFNWCRVFRVLRRVVGDIFFTYMGTKFVFRSLYISMMKRFRISILKDLFSFEKFMSIAVTNVSRFIISIEFRLGVGL